MVALRAALTAAAAALALAPAAADAATMPGCARTDVTGGEWRSFGHDFANTRSQPAEKTIQAADVPTLATTWAFSSVGAGGGGDFTGTPIVADGCVYAASSRGWVFALNADDGKLIWKAQLPYGGGVNSSALVTERTVAAPAVRSARRTYQACLRRARKLRSKSRRASARRACLRRYRRARSKARKTQNARAGTVIVYATRTQKAEGCPPGDACIGPYAVAFDQATGARVWATGSLDSQPGADTYGSPVIFGDVLMIGTSGGSAELGDEADRYAFQGSMTFLDADDGSVLKKTWTIHPPKQPDDEFAGGGLWSTPAIDTEDKVAFVGSANPFKPQAEHKYTNSVLRFDVDRSSPTFGQVTGSYKGQVDEYIPGFSDLPCYDFPSNNPPYYPQGVGSCGDVDLDFGASPNLFRDASGRKLVGAGQKSGVYHIFDARTMEAVRSQIVGPPTSVGGIVGSTAFDGASVFGPITVPGYVWSIDAATAAHRWIGPVLDGAHWGPPVAVANGVVYSVDFTGHLDAFDARNGTLLTKRPLALGGGGPVSLSWAGVSIARNTVYASVGVLGLADGFIIALRPGGLAQLQDDLDETLSNGAGGGAGGGGGGGAPIGPSILSGPGAASTGYATPLMVTQVGGPLSYLNLDNVLHDVVAEQTGPDGQPLFRTTLVGLGESAPVEGLDRVQAGQYAFYCSVHPGMRGNLIVQ